MTFENCDTVFDLGINKKHERRKKFAPTGVRTQITGFEDRYANHCTIEAAIWVEASSALLDA